MAPFPDHLRPWQESLRAAVPDPHRPSRPRLPRQCGHLAEAADAVLDAVQSYLTRSNANAGRGTYPWANATTAMVERVRGRVKAFLGDPAPERSRVDFTSGTSEGLRAVALDWLPGCLRTATRSSSRSATTRPTPLPWLEARDLLARRGVRVAVREMPYQEGSGTTTPPSWPGRSPPARGSSRRRTSPRLRRRHERAADAAGGRTGRRDLSGRGAERGPRAVRLWELDVDLPGLLRAQGAGAAGDGGGVVARTARARLRTWRLGGNAEHRGHREPGGGARLAGRAGVGRIETWTESLAARLTDGLAGCGATRSWAAG